MIYKNYILSALFLCTVHMHAMDVPSESMSNRFFEAGKEVATLLTQPKYAASIGLVSLISASAVNFLYHNHRIGPLTSFLASFVSGSLTGIALVLDNQRNNCAT